MKKTLFLALAALGIAGCAKNIPPPEGSALLPEIDVVQVKENSDEALRLAQETKLDVEALNSKVTELGNQVGMLSDDISNISVAKIEEIENRLAILWEETKAIQKMLEGVELKKKTPPAPPMATFKPSEAKAQEAAREASLEKKAERIDNVKANLKGGNHDAYQNALRTFNARDYNNAIKMFKVLLEDDPKGTYADNCIYWIGECFYMMGDFAQAVGWYKKSFDYTDTEKADDSQFKIAKCYVKLGETGHAIAEYEKLLSMYPASEYAGQVKTDLQKLKSR